MIHGYSVSGNTFTHESLRPSAAEWFHHRGRDVWVLDLRSSSGLPTATVPWTLEEVALVDIPAALLYVRQVTGAPVDVLAHCIGCVMLSMALLSRPRELLDRARMLDRPAPLDTAQQAALAAFNGDGGAGRQHPTVRRLVLSQTGPVLRYTDANVLRGWVMQYARRWLLRDGYQFRPSATPGAGEQLLDRLLASLPYPDADWRVENPRRPWKRTPWTATRCRCRTSASHCRCRSSTRWRSGCAPRAGASSSSRTCASAARPASSGACSCGTPPATRSSSRRCDLSPVANAWTCVCPSLARSRAKYPLRFAQMSEPDNLFAQYTVA
jgi:pimeloyl-ACP methyl ester carboxylesterase